MHSYTVGSYPGPSFKVWEMDAGPGPVVVVLGGVHGDEYEGMLLACRLAAAPPAVRRGKLMIVTVANDSAFRHGARNSDVDGANLARAFPGNQEGAWTERLAYLLTDYVIEGADFLIDLHSAGLHFEMPPLVGVVGKGPMGGAAIAAAQAIGMPFLWIHDDVAPGRTLSVAHERDIAAIYLELPGGPHPSEKWMARALDGLHIAITKISDMTLGVHHTNETPVTVYGSGDLDTAVIRADIDGLFLPKVKAGQLVEAGAVVGKIYDPHAPELQPLLITSRVPGYIMMLRRTARINVGDVLASVSGSGTKP